MMLDEADWGREGNSSICDVPIEDIAVWYAREAEPDESVFAGIREGLCNDAPGSCGCRP